jgi:hypothetical protein
MHMVPTRLRSQAISIQFVTTGLSLTGDIAFDHAIAAKAVAIHKSK